MNKKSEIIRNLLILVPEIALKEWLQKPNSVFSNKIPIEMLDAGDFSEIEDMKLKI